MEIKEAKIWKSGHEPWQVEVLCFWGVFFVHGRKCMRFHVFGCMFPFLRGVLSITTRNLDLHFDEILHLHLWCFEGDIITIQLLFRDVLCFNPIGSMYSIFTYIWLKFMVNVGKYTIHGSYRNVARTFLALRIAGEEFLHSKVGNGFS